MTGNRREGSQGDFEPGSWERDLGRVLFRSRHAAIVALAAAGAAVPAIGPQRLWIAAAVMAIALPYDLLLARWTRRRGRMPRAMAYANQVIGFSFPLLAPTTWVPVLLVLVAEVGLASAAFGRRTAARAALLGTAGLSAVAVIVRPPDAIVGLLAFVIAAAMILMTVGAVFDGERRLRQRYGALVEGLDAILWESTPGAATYTYVSHGAEVILGYPVEAWITPHFWRDHIHPDDRDEAVAFCARAIARGADHELEYRMLAADGRVVHLHDLVRVETDPAGRPVNVRGVMIDVTDHKRAEERVRQYADLVENIQVALLVLRLEDEHDPLSLRIVAANPQVRSVTTRDPADLIGQRIGDAFPELARTQLPASLHNVIRAGEAFDYDNMEVTSGGSLRVYALRAFPLPGDAVGVALDDVTGPTMAAEALRRQALHDGLTGLPNRSLLNDRLQQALRVAQRTGTSVALLVMDLDQFKDVNDALGHHHGDRLLIELSRRLEDLLRECDTIARLGGDEFALLLTTNADRAGATNVAEKVTRALEQPFEVDGLTLQTNASIGIALFPEHATDAESLAQRADVAMYAAKRGAGSYAVYAAENDRSSVRRLTLLGELRRALQLDELVLHYQPGVDLRTGGVVRAEALVRWNHPVHGLMLPGEFIELAEVSGLIQPLTRWVLERAVIQARAWQTAGHDIGVAVNLSVRNLYDPELAPWLRALLGRVGLAASKLTVEITESQLMDDPLQAMEVLGQVGEMGVATSIDDFGTGYSSLTYLKHLPIREIKIDRSFVLGMRTDESDATIVRWIIDLGHDLDLGVVAEGVEDQETLERLRQLGCDRAQGFHLSPPVPARDLTSRLAVPHRA